MKAVKMKHAAFIIILFHLFFLSCADDAMNDEEVKFVNLQDLSSVELEAICSDRGFELIPQVDPTTGEILEYTHDDYVEAAQQCLEVEGEMEIMFKQNPSILSDLEKERDRMQAMKDELEAEIIAKQEQLEATRKVYGSTTFLPNESNVDEENNEEVTSSINEDYSHVDNTIGEDTISESVDINKDSINKSNTQKQDHEFVSSLKKSKIQQLPNNTTASDEKRKNYNPLGLRAIVQESIQELKNRVVQDIQMVANIVFPRHIRKPVITKILIPLLKITKSTGSSAADLIKRYFKVAVADLVKPKAEEGVQAQ